MVLAPACSRLTYALQSQPLDCGTGASMQLAAQGCLGHLPIQDRSHGAKGAYVEGDNSAPTAPCSEDSP